MEIRAFGFPDTPMGLLRAILLEACRLVASEGNNAAILWLTAADTLPLLRLGREEFVVRGIAKEWAGCMEKEALDLSKELASISDDDEAAKIPQPAKLTVPKLGKMNREELLNRVSAAAGPNYRNNALPNPNPRWPNQPEHWAWEFSDRMSVLLADKLDALIYEVNGSLTTIGQQILAFQDTVATLFVEASNCQQHIERQTHLNALWWSEALYSPSLRKSYREIPPPLAATVMAVDILAEVAKPTPASVGYLLAEAVNRLPEAGFERKFTLAELFRALHENRGQLHKGWLQTLVPPPDQGRLSLRDAAWLALTRQEQDLTVLMQRIGASEDVAMSLPAFAHALFRQEQAVQLAGSR